MWSQLTQVLFKFVATPLPHSDQQLSPPSSSFERCPFEIAAHIVSMEVSLPDALNLRLSSRTLCSLFTPLAFQRYTHCIKLSWKGIENSPERLLDQSARAYIPVPAAFAPHIVCLKLTVLPDPSFKTMESANTGYVDGNRKFGRLWKELSQLTSVKSFAWADECEGDYDAEMLSLMDQALLAVRAASGDHLQKVHIHSEVQYGLPNSLTMMDGLSELVFTLSWLWKDWSSETERLEKWRALVRKLRSIITRNSSTLEYLNILLSRGVPLTLEDVFPPEAIELRLTTVHLEYIQESAPVALAALPQLRDLHLDYYSSRPAEADHIWDAFRVHGITLQETTNFATISHMKYLSSFSGLTNFLLIITSPVEPAAVDLFFSAVLPAQAASLEIILFRYTDSTPVYDGFVFSSHDRWFGRLSFPRLRHLGVYTPSDWDIDQSRCQSLLNDVQDLPMLESVYVQWPKYSGASDTLGRDKLGSLNTKTGRPSEFYVDIYEDSSIISRAVEVNKSDS